ncbi:S-layer homology domain-containing protein [Tepidanaerobacter syntrophicus]|uniref:S-layer homology domain-containing protein n=1 Tax=Tepidanaerobacter syntrophicus TaxID=224999 RepID=A0A0U9HFB9_9FIRM|nr:S-layer homology domain-containing protein [Tepidanaerobacter syntrophicus]GAQ24580.1 S-layer homology domain-containing protein [Tepidanaerobacter syntrophicus]
MLKKTLVVFLAALLALMPLAYANGQTEDNVDKVLSYINDKIRPLGRGTAVNLLEIAKTKSSSAVETFFSKLDSDLKGRLSNKGISQTTIENAVGAVEGDGFYSATTSYINNYLFGNDTNVYNSYKTTIQAEFDKVFKDPGAPLEDFDDSVVSDFDGWGSFLSKLKNLEIDLRGDAVEFKYYEATNTLSVNEKTAGALKTKLNKFLSDNDLNILSNDEVLSLINAANAVLADLSSSETATLKSALGGLGYTVTTIPKPSDGGNGGGGTGGGGTGGGGGTTPEKPAVVTPKDTTQPISVNIPSDAVSITVSDGKAVVSLSTSTVNTVLKLIDEAAKTAEDEDRPLVITIDLSSSRKITEDTQINIPASIVEKAGEVDANILVILPEVSIEIPAAAVDMGDTENLEIVIQQIKTGKALSGITLPAGMTAVGDAADIVIKTDGTNAKITGKITIYFNLKGITANADKLGIYYVNGDKKTIEFVGGKVDKEKDTIRASVSHFSTYALIEYNKTFADIKYHWAKGYVESMAAKQIVNGKAENIFAPDDDMTRAEFAKIIVNAMELDLNKYSGSFEDVKAGDWFADYVQTAFDNKLIEGKVAGKVFDPNGKITREEMMTIIGRAIGKEGAADADTILKSFKDGDKVSSYAKEYVSLLIEEKLVNGYPDGTLKPANSITRAEAAKIVYGFYNYY